MKKKYCDIDYAAVGERIASCRKKAKLNQEELAEKVGCSRNAIVQVENNKSGFTIELICATAHYVGTTTDYLLAGTYHVEDRSERVLQKIQHMDDERFQLYLDIADVFIDK